MFFDSRISKLQQNKIVNEMCNSIEMTFWTKTFPRQAFSWTRTCNWERTTFLPRERK